MKITSLSETINEWLGQIDETASLVHYPFKVRLGCVKMASPRDSRFQLMRNLGDCDIDNLFNGKPFTSEHLTFVFPESELSVHEQQCFTSAFLKHPYLDQIKQIDIITSSPLLVGCFRRESINILTWSDDHLYNGSINH